MPDGHDEVVSWLERQLVSLDLKDLVTELAAVHHADRSPRDTLAGILGERKDEVLRDGLAVLPREQFRRLLTQPFLLFELQELILTHGGDRWRALESTDGARERTESEWRAIKPTLPHGLEGGMDHVPTLTGVPPRKWWVRLAGWLSAVSPRQPVGGPDGGTPPPRVLGARALIAMGIGATIGAGIFVTAGQVAAFAGPGVILSFVIAGVGCALAGLCYAEFAALAPTGGSAYSYAYATVGELLAWIIGWDLVLEYAFAGSIVAVEWALNLVALLGAVGINVPSGFIEPVNYLAVFIIAAVTVVLLRGVEESARANAVMVGVKVGVVLLVIVAGAWFVNPANWTAPPGARPGFLPNGFGVVVTGAAMVFFSYIGFDAVSTHAEETENPGRNLPIGILGSLVICTALYVGVAVVLVGMIPWPAMPPQAPVVNAFVQQGGMVARVAAVVIGVGAIAGMTSVLLVTYSGQARIFRAMSRDGLLPARVFGVRGGGDHTPRRSLVLTAVVTAVIAAATPADVLLGMVAIGTLLAFAIVCAAVMILRRTDPDVPRPFRVPSVYVIAPLGIAVNVYMMTGLEADAWIRLGAWLAVGLVVYFCYGYWNSEVRRRNRNGTPPNGAAA